MRKTTSISFVLLLALTGTIFSFSSVLNGFAEATAGESTYSYLALGDSYTICESIDESKQWPKQLAEELTNKGVLVDSPKIIAKTGWRTDNMLTAAKKQIGAEKYDLVSLLIGVNNEFQGQSSAVFEAEFKDCLAYSIAHCRSGKEAVFVVSIPDYGYTPFGKRNQKKINQRIDAYNEVCERICKEYEVAFFNITPISRKGLKNPDYVAQDGLHPSAKQYFLWVEQFSDNVKSLLSK